MKKLLIALLFVPCIARAEFMTGNDLYERLVSSDVIKNMVALGYVMGVFDTGQGLVHCAPRTNTITGHQINDIAKRYLEANPSNRHVSADLLVSNAFTIVWPCPNRNNKGKI